MANNKMPIDISAVIKEAMSVEQARSVPLCVSVLLDDNAPADLQAFVRSAFASASPQARVSVNYFSSVQAAFDPRSDMAVIAAGTTAAVGEIAARVRGAGIPVMVVTSLPESVAKAAKAAGFAIPEGDLLAPTVENGDVVALSNPVTVSSADTSQAYEYDGFDPYSLEPYVLNPAFEQELSERMGDWVVATFAEKKLAFAQAFDFVRKPLSKEAVRATSFQNAGVGVVLVLPGADLPVMTLNQAKMVLQIAAAYGQPLTIERAKELAGVVAGGFACRAVARQLVGLVPALGWAVKGAIGYTGTAAIGNAAIQYFEHGGNLTGLAGMLEDAYGAVSKTVSESAKGESVQEVVASLGSAALGALAKGAKKAVSSAPDAAKQTAKSAAALLGGMVGLGSKSAQ